MRRRDKSGALATAPRPTARGTAGARSPLAMVDVVGHAFRIGSTADTIARVSCGECIEAALGPRKLTSGGSYSRGFAASPAVNRLTMPPLPASASGRTARCSLHLEAEAPLAPTPGAR